MTKSSTIKTKRQARRRRILKLVPTIKPWECRALSAEDNPIVRVGMLLDICRRDGLDERPVEEARLELSASVEGTDEAVALLEDVTQPRGRAAAIGLLGLKQGVAYYADAIATEYRTVDDRGYRPARQDSLLHGPGRATGAAARAARRRTTYAKWQIND